MENHINFSQFLAYIAPLIALVAAVVSAAITYIATIVRVKGRIKNEVRQELRKTMNACQETREQRESEIKNCLDKLTEGMQRGDNEFKVLRLALSELFEANKIPRAKLDQIRDDVSNNRV